MLMFYRTYIVHNYNNSYHKGIDGIPAKYKEDRIKQINIEKQNKAKQEETIFQIGDNVRYIINRMAFVKGTLPKWWATVHEIIAIDLHSYTLYFTIDDDITIFDVNTCYTDREYVYTAVSRVRSVDQLTVFNHSTKEANRLYDSRIKQYFNLKIPNYMQQDKKCFRDYNINDYVNTEWIYKQLNKQNI